MRAIVKTAEGPGNIQFAPDWPEPQVGEDLVKIEVAYSGICGTDLHIWKGEWPCRPPVVLGHEFSGVVVEVGPWVSSVQVGDRVVAGNPAWSCGRCRHCRAGNPVLCSERVSIGYMVDGSFADWIVMREGAIHRVPDSVSLEEAALCEPLAVAVRAILERSTIRPTDTVLIIGPGPTGLLSAAVAKAQGAAVLVAGRASSSARLDAAHELGADHVINLSVVDLKGEIDRFVGREGVDVAVECAGAQVSVEQCLSLVRKGGQVVQVGLALAPLSLEYDLISRKELTVTGVYGYAWTSWETALALLEQGKVKVRPLISQILGLEEWQRGFEAVSHRNAIKVLLAPRPGEKSGQI